MLFGNGFKAPAPPPLGKSKTNDTKWSDKMSILCKIKKWLKAAWKVRKEASLVSTCLFNIITILGLFLGDIKLIVAAGLIGCMLLLLNIIVRVNALIITLQLNSLMGVGAKLGEIQKQLKQEWEHDNM